MPIVLKKVKTVQTTTWVVFTREDMVDNVVKYKSAKTIQKYGGVEALYYLK